MAHQNEVDMTEEERREVQNRRERMIATVISSSPVGRPMDEVIADAEKGLRYIQEGKANG